MSDKYFPGKHVADHGLIFDVRSISPSEAHALIENGRAPNRRMRESRVLQYESMMERGEWALDGEPIIFDQNGKLIDGQHRLSAVARQESSIAFLVVIVPDDARRMVPKIDRGVSRGLGDILQIAGHSDTLVFAAMLRWVSAWKKGWSIVSYSASVPSADEALRFIRIDPSLAQAVQAVGSLTELGAPSAWAFLIWLLRQADEKKANSFFEILRTGESLTRTSPIKTWRDRLIKDRSRRKRILFAPEIIALTIKTWNLWCVGLPAAKCLGWKRTENLPEPEGVPQRKKARS